MKKRILSLALAAILLAACALPGLADSVPEVVWTERRTPAPETMPSAGVQPPAGVTVTSVSLRGYAVFNGIAQAIGFKAEDSDCYALLDADGRPLTNAIFSDLEMDYHTGYFFVTMAGNDPARSRGMVDDSGRTVVPAQYAKVVVVSERWMIGEQATPVGSGQDVDFFAYDASSGVRQGYAISGIDVYYRGSLAGSLTAADYTPGVVRAYGDTLCLCSKAGQYVYYSYSGGLVRSSYDSSGDSYYGEYASTYVDGKSIYTHRGTNQVAFAPGCTLTPDQVESALMFDYSSSAIINLQGQAIVSFSDTDSAYLSNRYGNYYSFELNDHYGLIDLNGNSVVHPLYTNIGQYTDQPLFEHGYVYVASGDRFGFVDARGNVTCPLIYPGDYNHNWISNNSFVAMENLDGTVTVITGPRGELPETFATVEYPEGDCALFAAKRLDESWCVFDLEGTPLLQVDDAWWLYVNNDGSLALAGLKEEDQQRNTANLYTLYHIQR